MRLSGFMRNLPLLCLHGAMILLVASCQQTAAYFGDHPTGTGPFDDRGNYVESWADSPSKWNGRKVPEPAARPKPQETESQQPPQLAQNTVTQQPTYTPPPTPQVNPKPKPKPSPKPKPKFVYHTVRKGDTLYGLAKRYGTTVGKIQQTNGIKGSVIRLNQKLKIPR